MPLITTKTMITEMILSVISWKNCTENTLVKMLLPAAMSVAVKIEPVLPVAPPKTSAVMKPEQIVPMMVMMRPEIATFHTFVNMPLRARRPAVLPTATEVSA